jgi:hypothetical protein
MHRDYMHKRPDKGDSNWAWPTPRSWEKVSNTRKLGPPEGLKFNLYAADVGEAASTSFISHEKVASQVPDPEDCINKPDKAKVPENPSAKYAIACSLVYYATPENFGSIMQYMSRVGVEFQVIVVKEATASKPELIETKAFTDFGEKNIDVLLG